eukprot:SAG31_NODE_14678_length_793_cov_1.106628_1_plen_263_part_11
METMPQLHSIDVRSSLAECSDWSDDAMNSTMGDHLIALWEKVRERNLGLYSIAVRSYFQYLSVAQADTTRLASDNSGNAAMIDSDQNIMVTLRLLRLLIKHGSSLQSVLSDGFQATPIGPWSAIIPQIFARIGHPNEYVRSQVQMLVAKIAQESPHLIIWPAIVGHQSAEDDGSRSLLDPVFDTLSRNFPELMREARSMISEFTRISVLWEEVWMTTLHDVENDALSRIRRLKEELSRVSQNESLSHSEKTRILGEKCQAIMK